MVCILFNCFMSDLQELTPTQLQEGEFIIIFLMLLTKSRIMKI